MMGDVACHVTLYYTSDERLSADVCQLRTATCSSIVSGRYQVGSATEAFHPIRFGFRLSLTRFYFIVVKTEVNVERNPAVMNGKTMAFML